MGPFGSRDGEIKTLRENGDVASLLSAYAGTKRRDRRRAIIQALSEMGEAAEHALLDMLGDQQLQREAAAVLVELGEGNFPVVATQLRDHDEARRRGALLAVYYYARYRDLPAAHELLAAVAAGDGTADLAEPAAAMSQRVERLTAARNEEIDRQLGRIKASLERDNMDRGNIAFRMYSPIHSGRMEALKALVALRYAGARHVIAVAPEAGEASMGVLLGLGLDELGGGVVPLIAEELRTGDRRTRGFMLTTLLCLRRARVPGAAEALEQDGVKITESMDRRAAMFYRQWVRER